MSGQWRLISAALVLVVAGFFLQSRSRPEHVPPRQPLGSFPETLGAWNGNNISISQETLEVLGPGDFLLRNYEKSADGPYINLFVAYFGSQRAGDTIHSPKNCLPGAGWSPVEASRTTLSFPGHQPFPANRYVIAKGADRQLVLYWYWAHDRGVASEYWAKLFLVSDAMRLNRTDGSLVRLTTPITMNETEEDAEKRLVSFAGLVIPILNHYVPR